MLTANDGHDMHDTNIMITFAGAFENPNFNSDRTLILLSKFSFNFLELIIDVSSENKERTFLSERASTISYCSFT